MTTSIAQSIHRTLVASSSLALLLALAVSPLEGARVRPVNLEEIAARADRIFAGRCVDVRVDRDVASGLDVTRVVFEVERAVKGALGETVTIKLMSQGDTTGATRFEPGEEVVLFLYADSPLGLTSPVALGQGKFHLFTDKEGQKLALNPFGNEGLFRDLSPEASQRLGDDLLDRKGRSGLPLETLLDGVERLVRSGATAPEDAP